MSCETTGDIGQLRAYNGYVQRFACGSDREHLFHRPRCRIDDRNGSFDPAHHIEPSVGNAQRGIASALQCRSFERPGCVSPGTPNDSDLVAIIPPCDSQPSQGIAERRFALWQNYLITCAGRSRPSQNQIRYEQLH